MCQNERGGVEGGGGIIAGSQPISTAVECGLGAQINFGDLTPYLTMMATARDILTAGVNGHRWSVYHRYQQYRSSKIEIARMRLP